MPLHNETVNTEHHAPDHNHHTQQHWYLVSKGITVHSNASSQPRIWYLVSKGITVHSNAGSEPRIWYLLVSKGVLQCVACGLDSRLLMVTVKRRRRE